MKVLIVASKTSGHFSPFVMEQVKALSELGVDFEFVGISQKGILGYLKSYKYLIKKIKEYRPDLIHAHYGFSGLLANMQRRIQVITTYHGNDVHTGGYSLILSRISMSLSVFNIFVSHRLYEMAKYKGNNYAIIPCGVDTNIFYEISCNEARQSLNWQNECRYILFAGAFEHKVKNALLAKEAIALIGDCHLVELKGYNRQEVNILMNGCDCLLMTSDEEGSPMVVKEAMACNVSVVSTDVGDVKWLFGEEKGYYISNSTVEGVVEKMKEALTSCSINKCTNGRERMISLGLDSVSVAKRITSIYKQCLIR